MDIFGFADVCRGDPCGRSSFVGATLVVARGLAQDQPLQSLTRVVQRVEEWSVFNIRDRRNPLKNMRQRSKADEHLVPAAGLEPARAIKLHGF